jgi:hypothetical protein
MDKFYGAVTFPTVNRWENNRGTPSLRVLEKIEGMLRSAKRSSAEPLGSATRSLWLLDSPLVTRRELTSSLLNKYFPEEDHRL